MKFKAGDKIIRSNLKSKDYPFRELVEQNLIAEALETKRGKLKVGDKVKFISDYDKKLVGEIVGIDPEGNRPIKIKWSDGLILTYGLGEFQILNGRT